MVEPSRLNHQKAVVRSTVHVKSAMYTIFTSGSTGRPKGVVVEHQSAVNVFHTFATRLGVSSTDRIFQFFHPSFDPSVLDYMLALLTGATLVLWQGPWQEALSSSGATITGLTPSALSTISTLPPSLRCVMIGGEALPLSLAQQHVMSHRTLLNVYGPTETTIWVTAAEMSASDLQITIGAPLPNCKCLVLDDQMRPSSIGETGELFIGGKCVARGYLNRADLTRRSFVQDPDDSDARLYRSGDLAYWTADGLLVCVGRSDEQVKLRGYRVELGEIESVAMEAPGVRAAASLLQTNENGRQELHLFVTPIGGTATEDMLRTLLVSRLPSYMLPDVITLVACMPTTLSGKLDRRALAAMSKQGQAQAHLATEQPQMAQLPGLLPSVQILPVIVEELQKCIGKRAHQLDLDIPLMQQGVSSLDALTFTHSLSSRLNRQLPSTIIFDHPTAKKLAQALEGRKVATYTSSHSAASAGLLPLTSACRFEGGGVHLPGGIRTCAQLWATCGAVDTVGVVPAMRWTGRDESTENGASAVKHGGFLADAHRFDAVAFRVSAAEASTMSPLQRLLLEEGYHAMHAAQHRRSSLIASATGVFIGVVAGDYRMLLAQQIRFKSADTQAAYAATGSASSVASGRVSYVLGLHGPCISLDTACSSALVACQSALAALKLGEATDALVGACNLMFAPQASHALASAGMLSWRGRCHTMDWRADGYVRAEGCATVLLREQSADSDAAMLLVCPVRSDGASASLTAPNGLAQQLLLHAAHAHTKHVAAAIEAHGTGTALGDPVEVQALHQVLRGAWSLCGIKAAVGHGEALAGMSGLSQLLYAALHSSATPPNVQLRVVNPHVCSVVEEGALISAQPLSVVDGIGGVSSFGYSGTIVHASVQPPNVMQTWRCIAPRVVIRFRFRRRSFRWAPFKEVQGWTSGDQEALSEGRSSSFLRGTTVKPANDILPSSSPEDIPITATPLEILMAVAARVLSVGSVCVDASLQEQGLDSTGVPVLIEQLAKNGYAIPHERLIDGSSLRVLAQETTRLEDDIGVRILNNLLHHRVD